MKPSESLYFDLKGVRMHVRAWGEASDPLVVMLHGWMDAGASFQFTVDAMRGRWRVLAPDWRGHGRSSRSADGVYTYFQHLADLDALLEIVSPEAPVRLVGHSLGGNIACHFAAARPERARAVVSIDAFGLRARAASEVSHHYGLFLAARRRDRQPRPYATIEEVMKRVRDVSPRVTEDRARFIATHWSEPLPDGTLRMRVDPYLRHPNPDLQRLDEMLALWHAIEAPVMWIAAAQSENIARHGLDETTVAERRNAVRRLTNARLDDCGHMVHWDRPEQLAALVERFLAEQGEHAPG